MRFLICAAALLALASPASARWHEASTDHFLIYSEDKPEALRGFAEKLEKYDAAMRFVRGMEGGSPGAANRLTIFVVPSVAAVQKVLGARNSDVAGFYIPRAEGSVAFTPRRFGDRGKFDMNSQVVLLHEYAHHFLMQNMPAALPAWLIEGYSEFSSTALFEKDGSVGIGAPAHHRAYWLLNGNPLPVDKMMGASVEKLNAEQREAIYGRGWLLTHYLTFEPSRAGQLTSYVRRINKGERSIDAAKAVFGDLKKLDKELEKYLDRARISYWKLPPERIKIGKIAIRELGPGESAVMDVRIRSKRGVDEAEAKALVPRARKAAAPFPNDVAAQVALAEAEYDAGNYTEAEAAADRALATDPKSIDALIYKGRARMARAEAASSTDEAAWKDVRKWLAAANRLDPDDPEPLILFYRSYLAQGEPPTANAADGLVYALGLAPQDRHLRWMVAYQHLKDGKAAEARAALAPVAFDPHGGKSGEAASSIIAKLDAGGTKAALEAWDSMPGGPSEEG